MAKEDIFGFFSGRGAKQKADARTRGINRMLAPTRNKMGWFAKTIRWGKTYRTDIRRRKK